jgi:AraC-like DNA-binding protein
LHPPSPSLSRHSLEDAETQARLQQPWADIVCRQIGPGRRVGSMTTLALGSLRLVHETQEAAVHKVASLTGGICTVSLAEVADDATRYSQFGGEPASRKVFFLPHGLEADVTASQHMRTAYVTFDQDRLMDRLRALDPVRWDSPPDTLVALETPRRDALLGAMKRLFAQFGSTSNAAALGSDVDRMSGMLTDIAAFALAGRPRDADHGSLKPSALTPDRTLRILRAAYAYSAETVDQGLLPSVADMCARVGTSERTLQQAFRSHLSMSPSTYLRLARMNRVRASLLAPAGQDPSVTEIAMHWGFFHLGRFAADYRAMFGERPSQTLARALGSSPGPEGAAP